MRLTCKANVGKALPTKYFKRGYTPDSIFHVAIGKDYLVYGMALDATLLVVLLSDEDRLPNWYPIDLFIIADSQLPDDWYFAAYPGNESMVQAIWGYETLVSNASHNDALMDRDPEALKIFYQREYTLRGVENSEL